MLKKLVSTLAITGLAFGSGLCFNPYNHDYGYILKDSGFGFGEKTIILHNGKMQVWLKAITFHNGKMMQVWQKARIKLIKYTVKGNKALMLIRFKGYDYNSDYFVVYTECVNGKPVTKDTENIGLSSASMKYVNLPKYPIKFGFYKDGYWTKGLVISWIMHMNGEGNGPGGYACDYQTTYYPYKLINEHKTYDAPYKDHYLSKGLCQVLGNKYMQ